MFTQNRRWRSKKPPRIQENTIIRLRLLFFRMLTVAVFLFLSIQLWRLQVVDGRYYQQRAENNRLRLVSIPAPRGVIYDRNNVLLVRNIPSFTVSIVPADLPRNRQQEVATVLSKILEIPPETIIKGVEEARTPNSFFQPIPIKTNVDQGTAFTVEEMHLQLPGVVVRIDPLRQYLEGAVTAHTLGYMGRITREEYTQLKDLNYQLNDKLGKAGVERSFEKELRGKLGWEQVEVDANGRKVSTLSQRGPEPGHNLILTIDIDLQRKITELVRQNMGQSRYAVAIAMNPKTGEVLAMVSQPSYDDNLFNRDLSQEEWDNLLRDPNRPLLNYAVGSARPPGSVFKLITASAALQEGVATPSTRIYSSGQISVTSQYDPRVIYTFPDWAALGWLDFYQAIARSSDVYFYHLAGGYQQFKGLGADRLAWYAREFGLGSPTGIDLSGEAGGLIPDAQWKMQAKNEVWLLGDTYHMGIGQGDVLASPLQILNMTVTVANGGELLKPQIVRRVVDSQGKVIKDVAKETIRRVEVSPENLEVVRRGMREAVKWGTATAAQIPGVEVAAKTGTAEFGALDPRTGQRPIHGWFVAFAPYDDPQIAIVVFQETGQGALTAAPLGKEILSYYFARRKN